MPSKRKDHNQPIDARLRQAMEKIAKLEDDRKRITAEISAVKAEEVKPIMKLADFNAGMRFFRLINGSGDDAEENARAAANDIIIGMKAAGAVGDDLFSIAAADRERRQAEADAAEVPVED